jgi:hypothetical protein
MSVEANKAIIGRLVAARFSQPTDAPFRMQTGTLDLDRMSRMNKPARARCSTSQRRPATSLSHGRHGTAQLRAPRAERYN